MISKYPGVCRYCKKPTLAGKDHYDLESKTGYHSKCQEDAENAPASQEQYELADRLGYVHYDWSDLRSAEVDDGRQMRHLSGGGSSQESRPGSPSRGLEDRLPGMSEEEEE